MTGSNLSEATRVPLGWVFALLVGCASTLSVAVFIGSYVGNNDARASALEKRVESLEAAIEVIPRIDRRLARMEGARGVTAPAEDRFPANEDK